MIENTFYFGGFKYTNTHTRTQTHTWAEICNTLWGAFLLSHKICFLGDKSLVPVSISGQWPIS